MSGLTVAILGLGSIGIRHARNARQLGHSVLGFDPSVRACRQLEANEIGQAGEKADVLRRADAVVIATPNQFHLRDLGDAIEAGKPALVEKPLGHDAGEARTLVRRAERSNLVVATAQNLRFRPVVRRVRGLLEAGQIGQPVWASFECASWLPDWRPGSDYRQAYAADRETGGVIFDNIHEIDLAVHLLGTAKVCSAVANRTGLLDMPSEDVADIVLQHDIGCQTRVHVDYVTRPRRRTLTVAGSGGILLADLRSGDISVRGIDDATVLTETAPFDPNDEYVALIADFLATATSDSRPACPADEALAVLELACEARRLAGLPQGRSMVDSEIVAS